MAFSSSDATERLTLIAQDALVNVSEWLEVHHPGRLDEKGPGEAVDALLQGICNAWVVANGEGGGPVVHAMAHTLAKMVFQQEDHPQAWANFEHLFRQYYSEQLAAFEPQGHA